MCRVGRKGWGRNGRLSLKNPGQPPAPKLPQSLAVAWSKGVGSCYSERQSDLTFRAGDAGASPRKACTLAAIHSLVNRASAPDGGVRLVVVCAEFDD